MQGITVVPIINYCCPKNSMILFVISLFHHKGLKTSQLSAVVHRFTPEAEVDVPALYQEHIKSS